MTAGLPRSCHGATARTSFLRVNLLVQRAMCVAARRPGFSMMDGSVRGSYDINYAKFGR
jgi:hypothetical protein